MQGDPTIAFTDASLSISASTANASQQLFWLRGCCEGGLFLADLTQPMTLGLQHPAWIAREPEDQNWRNCQHLIALLSAVSLQRNANLPVPFPRDEVLDRIGSGPDREQSGHVDTVTHASFARVPSEFEGVPDLHRQRRSHPHLCVAAVGLGTDRDKIAIAYRVSHGQSSSPQNPIAKLSAVADPDITV